MSARRWTEPTEPKLDGLNVGSPRQFRGKLALNHFARGGVISLFYRGGCLNHKQHLLDSVRVMNRLETSGSFRWLRHGVAGLKSRMAVDKKQLYSLEVTPAAADQATAGELTTEAPTTTTGPRLL
jgi:hypothetical protein